MQSSQSSLIVLSFIGVVGLDVPDVMLGQTVDGSMAFIPPGFLMGSVEKLVWAPAPFKSPCMGLGSKLTTTPNSSATLVRRYLASQRSSPMSIPTVGPTWNSHWAGMTSALVPLILIPA